MVRVMSLRTVEDARQGSITSGQGRKHSSTARELMFANVLGTTAGVNSAAFLWI